MSSSSSKTLRRHLSRLHPRKVWHKLRHLAHRLGYYRLRLYVLAFDPRRILNTLRFARGMKATLARRRREPRLTVAVDISPFWEPLTGIGWYLYRLLQNLADRDDLRLRLYGPAFIDKGDVPAPVVELPTGRAIELVSYRVPEDLSFVHYYVADQLRARQARLIAADGNRVLFAPNYFLPPWFDRCEGRLVATIHDLSVRRVPETMRDSTRLDLERRLEETARRAVRIITDSETVREELIASGLATGDRITAVHLAPGSVASVAPADRRLPEGLPERYALFVGTLEPRKNLPLLLDAWQELRRRGVDAPALALCGGFGWKFEELQERIEQGCAEGWLLHFGYLEDHEVAALYAGADVVTLPSLYEGFGLPAVEAMSFGVPLLCADLPVLREVAGPAALYAAARPETWADQLSRLFEDPDLARRLGALGEERSARFSWERTAEQTARVWREARDVPEPEAA